MFAYKMYPTFRQTFVYNWYKKFSRHSSFNFVYKMYTKVFRNGVYILCTFCIHLLYISCNHLYNFCIQNANTISVYSNEVFTFLK